MSRANKRPLAERDPNICFPPAKRVAKGEKPKRERTSAKGHFEKQPFEGRYEYICVKRPPWNKEGGESDGDGEEQEDAESDESKQVSMKPASSLYIFNDFHGYGLIEILENIKLKAFNAAVKSQGRTKPIDFHKMWAATATLVHFLLHEASMPWTHVDDGERVTQLTRVVGCAILTALNELERIGQFSGDSKFRDLGLVMALYLRWSKAPHATTLTEDGDIDFQEMIVAYANKIELDLTEQGVGDLEDVVTTFEDAELPEGKAKVEQWGWTEVVGSYRETHADGWRPKLGGQQYNIMKWSREKRAEHAFDKRDPLAEFSAEMIASGELVMS